MTCALGPFDSDKYFVTALDMASTTALSMSAEESLFEDGFFYARDAALGEDISEMQRRGFPYYSSYGLDFCQQYVLNEVSQWPLL